MNDKKRRLGRFERAANGDERRVAVYWGREERPGPEPGQEVVVITWPEDDGEAASRPHRP